MKTKTLAILAGVTVVLAAGAAVLTTRESTPAATGLSHGRLFADLEGQAAQAAKVTIKRGAVETVLARAAGGWAVQNRDNYPADFDKVRKLVRGVAEADILEAKTSKPELYERLGLHDADAAGATRVSIEDASGKALAVVLVGNSHWDGGPAEGAADTRPKYFARRDGEAQTFLVRGDLAADASPMSWINRVAVDVDSSKVRSVVVTHASAPDKPEERVIVSKTAEADPNFKLEGLPEGRQLKDEYAATRVAQALGSVSIDDVAAAGAIDFSTPLLTAEYRTFDGLVIGVKMVEKDAKKWFAFSASYEEPAAKPDAATEPDAAKKFEETAAEVKKQVEELSAKWAPWAFVMPEWKVNQLNVRTEALLKPLETPVVDTPAAPAEQPQDSILVPPKN
jgi:hypothetical protein